MLNTEHPPTEVTASPAPRRLISAAGEISVHWQPCFALATFMALGTWDPKLASQSDDLALQPAVLQKLIAFDRADALSQLAQLLSSDEQQRLCGLMQLDHAQWRAAAEPLPDNDLLHLIRFFAVAENLPGWESGAKSPVIPLAKLLRERGARLDKSLLQWLRTVSENRYLPYGPL